MANFGTQQNKETPNRAADNDLSKRNKVTDDGAQRAGGPSRGGSGVPDESKDDELDSHGRPSTNRKSGPEQDRGSAGGGQAKEKF
jgi:hypothetical protein